MSRVDMKTFEKLAREDFEFKRETRYLTGVIKVDFEDQAWGMSFANGDLAGITDAKDMPNEDCKIVVAGTSEQWNFLLQEKPKPFYQCLQSSAVKHGVMLSNTNETFAYLPGLNRMLTLMRQSVKGA